MPIWTEFHIAQLAEKLDSRETKYFSEEQKKTIQEECRKLDAFEELLLTGSDPVAAERKAYGFNGRFYREFDKLKTIWQRQKLSAVRKAEREKMFLRKAAADRRAEAQARKIFEESGFP